MIRTRFDAGWTIRRAQDDLSTPVTLPHDAMVHEPRSASAPSGSHGAYFPGGKYSYTNSWTAPTEPAAHTALLFEGVYGTTTVRLNGHVIAESSSPYREFRADLSEHLIAGAVNTIEVEVDNLSAPNSRWYTGSGIYRPVWLEQSAEVRFTPDSLVLHTLSVREPAVVEVAATAEHSPNQIPVMRAELWDGDTRIAITEGDVGTLRLEVPAPRLWSDEVPYLYRAIVQLLVDDVVVDTEEQLIGLRTIELDPTYGLQVNGKSVLLRGTNLHHDSGILGAATHQTAEFRRARILKDSGFNAIRSAHNPLSRDLLDACDAIGLYVIDELADYWHDRKTAHDLAPQFEGLWPDDARSMVAKDRNHPCVIMYSIGNEIGETATTAGVETSQRLNDFFHQLDPHRPTTLAVSFLVNVMVSWGQNLFKEQTPDHGTPAKPSKLSSTLANTIANKLGGIMNVVARTSKADTVSKAAFSTVDVCGYNYGWSRFAIDSKKHPERVSYSSESMPGDIAKIWPLVTKYPNVIGDFMWTGWDYLGESGIGTWVYGDDVDRRPMAYPLLTGGCGAIDITGVPGSPLLLAQAAWGDLTSPRIAVRPLDRAGVQVRRMAWRSTDAIESWAWLGSDGKPADIEVYSADDHVELILNGRSLGRKRVGKTHVVKYTTAYEPGEIVAVGYRDGREHGRTALHSAATPTLRVTAESDLLDADTRGLGFIAITMADEHGTTEMLADDMVHLTVEGPATLEGFGNASPASTEPFDSAEHSTWYGRALAVIRSTGEPGDISVTATSAHHGTATVYLEAVSDAHTDASQGNISGRILQR